MLTLLHLPQDSPQGSEEFSFWERYKTHAKDLPVLNGQHADAGIFSKTCHLRESRGSVSLANLSSTSCVRGYQGDLLNWNIPRHPTVSGRIFFPRDTTGFHTDDLNKRKARA